MAVKYVVSCLIYIHSCAYMLTYVCLHGSVIHIYIIHTCTHACTHTYNSRFCTLDQPVYILHINLWPGIYHDISLTTGIYGGVFMTGLSMQPNANKHVNVLLCPFNFTVLSHINFFLLINADVVSQEKMSLKPYIIVHCCPWPTILRNVIIIILCVTHCNKTCC